MNNIASQSKQFSFDDERRETRKFMRDEVFMLTLMGVLQRNHVYQSKPSAAGAAAFRRCLRKCLETIAEDYQRPVTDEAHIGNVKALAEQISEDCGELLYKSRFRIGSAQKALNLFLKYMWSLGEIPQPPPHCPFDRRIIEFLAKDAQCNWTECDKIEHYERWVAEARRIADKGSLSLARWELCEFNNEWRRMMNTEGES